MFCLQKCAAIYGLGTAMARVEVAPEDTESVLAVEAQRDEVASLLVDATDRIDELEEAITNKLVEAVPDMAGRIIVDFSAMEPQADGDLPITADASTAPGLQDDPPAETASMSLCLRCGDALEVDSPGGEALGPLCQTCDKDEMIKPTGTRRMEG